VQTGAAGWTAVWRLIVRFDRDKIAPWIALRNTAGMVIPLAAGAIAGQPVYGMTATLGAMNVSFSDGSDPYLPRVQRLLLATFLGATAITLGALTGNNAALAAVTIAIWAAGAGMLVALDTAAADIGILTLVMLLVFSGQPATIPQAFLAGLLALGGGLLQTALATALWPLRRFEPERRVLGELYSELARMPASPVSATTAPPASAHATEAQKLLSGLSRSSTVQGARYLSLLTQAERIRLSLLLLGRIRMRWSREAPTATAAEVLAACMRSASIVLEAIAYALERGIAPDVSPDLLPAIESAAEKLRGMPKQNWPAEAASLLDEAVFQIDALAGQLRSALELAASSTLPGRMAFERREETRPWRLRLEGTVATLRANLTLRSAAFRHAIRLAICVTAGELLARAIGGPRSYWLPMTVAIVLRPDFTTTFTRGVLRVAGTFAGLVLATVIFHLLAPSITTEIVLIGALAFVLRCFGPANYGIFVTAISAMIVLLFAMIGVAPGEVIAERAMHTLLGGVLALTAYAIWPTWERTQVSATLANLLDAYRDYFRVVREAYTHPERSFGRELDRVRLAARLARSNAEASIERFVAEPGTPPEAVQRLNAVLASSHRFVHALMALEAGLLRSRPLPARPQFIAFANQVELTLHSLAEALRGSRLRRDMLPDLREAHRVLAHSGDPLLERYALVNIETDRITNSLNTLTEQILEYLGQKR
jgi:uncharacterized membrane protein YccC